MAMLNKSGFQETVCCREEVRLFELTLTFCGSPLFELTLTFCGSPLFFGAEMIDKHGLSGSAHGLTSSG